MTTKKNIRLVTIVSLLVAATLFGVCGCKTEKPFMGPRPNTPTPSPVSARAPRWVIVFTAGDSGSRSDHPAS